MVRVSSGLAKTFLQGTVQGNRKRRQREREIGGKALCDNLRRAGDRQMGHELVCRCSDVPTVTSTTGLEEEEDIKYISHQLI